MSDHWKILNDKILSLDEAIIKAQSWKSKGDKIVFTNGCFDILHLGHVTYLTKAASLGTKLIVALNTDESVKILNKAPNRPIHNQLDRQLVVAGLGCVDGVILFNDPTPIHCIESLLPDVLVKGGDYDAKEENPENTKFIVGSTLIKKSGGAVITIDLVPGHSTTAILGK